MGTYASVSDVSGRLPGNTFDATSQPSTSQVSSWIDEAEAEIEGELASAGITTPVTAAAGIKVLRSWVADYAEGLTRRARAYAAGVVGDGDEQLRRYEAHLQRIRNEPNRVAAMLAGGSAATTGVRPRSWWTDTSAGGDDAPVFTDSEVF